MKVSWMLIRNLAAKCLLVYLVFLFFLIYAQIDHEHGRKLCYVNKECNQFNATVLHVTYSKELTNQKTENQSRENTSLHDGDKSVKTKSSPASRKALRLKIFNENRPAPTLKPTQDPVEIETANRKILQDMLKRFRTSTDSQCSQERHIAASTNDSGLKPCPCSQTQTLAERTNVSLEHLLHVSWSDVEVALTGISPGGHWRPTHCAPLRRVAVIIPFRDRGNHLRAFLLHTHPILQKQAVEYKIFVVEQNMPYIFNKGSLMNVGYIEVVEKSGFHPDCLVFHDVDLLMESERNIFMCREVPTHQAAYVDKFNYTLPYIKMFGGAVAIRPDQFVTLNGYSNQFVGWGGEDDDFFRRVYSKFRKFHRPPEEISRYTMIPHIRDSANPVNRNSSKGYKTPVSSFQDGLKTVEYDRLSLDVFPTHTRILVDLPLLKLSKTETLPEETIPRKDYESRKGQRCSDTVARDSYVSKVTCEYLCTASVKCPFYQFTQYSQQDDLCQIFNTTCSKVVEHEATDMFVLRTS